MQIRLNTFTILLLFLTLFGAAVLGWQLKQTPAISQEKPQSLTPSAVTTTTIDNVDINPLLQRLDRLEELVQSNAVAIAASLNKQTNINPWPVSQQEVNGFSNNSQGTDYNAPESQDMNEVLNDTYQALSDKIVTEGESPQNVVITNSALDTLKDTQQSLAGGITFEPAACSESRCVVKANISEAPFSTEKLSTETDFKATDSYHIFMQQVTKNMSSSFGRNTQVSITRSGDQLVLNVIPSEPQKNGTGAISN